MNPCIFTDSEKSSSFLEDICTLLAERYRPLAYFGTKSQELFCVMGNDETHHLKLLRGDFPSEMAYESLTTSYPVFHLFERELYEDCLVTPLGHPWLKPVRYPIERTDLHMSGYPFYETDSPALHEVAVGPVHAGVIEPGHFRFLCDGEEVQHLEIQLGYQHRGIRQLFLKKNIKDHIALAESIAGDTAIGHGLAYCHAVEVLSACKVTPEVEVVRAIALELERVAMHLADLSALSGDIAYLTGQSIFAALRTKVINLTLSICGSRFGKRWLTPGGILAGIDYDKNRQIRELLQQISDDTRVMCNAMWNDSGVLSRFDGTGVVNKETVSSLGITGMAARASGLLRDSRITYPYYPYTDFSQSIVLERGDVYCRAYLRQQEIHQSIDMIDSWLSELKAVPAQSNVLGTILPNAVAVSVCEGWRGEIVHIALTDETGSTQQYQIYDPSFHNWTALAMAVRNNGISDFPICNKSFNLSYCGFDL